MYKSVDETEDTRLEGFSYRNKHGYEEYVVLSTFDDLVNITLDREESGTQIYVEDIPKLIKALQMAYAHMKGN